MRKREPFPAPIQFVLLGLIHQGVKHGYQLYTTMGQDHPLASLWKIKQSHLYAMLELLERDGLITGENQQVGLRPPRKEYELTEKGRQAFQKWMSSPVEHPREMRQDFLARWYFAKLDNPPTDIDLINKQLTLCEEWQYGIQQQIIEATDQEDIHNAILQFRFSQVEGIIGWLKKQKEKRSQ